jgi:glucose-1-phosphatase
MIETFIFDMGNVLVHFSHERMCRQIAEICGLSPAEVRRWLFDSGLQWEFEKGRITEENLHTRLEEQTQRTLDFGALIHAASDIFDRNPAIEPMIDAIRSQGRRLVLLSNTSLSHFQFVRANFDVLSAFDAFVVSYEVGAMKPDKAIYDAALAAAGCPAEKCFYTDDIADYVAAGRRYGLQAEIYTSADALRGQLRERGVKW